MKIEATKIIKNLKGDAYKADGQDLTLGAVLAEAVANYDIGGKMKIYSLSSKLYNATETIEVDEADLSLIKKAVEGSKSYNNIILGQALLALE